LTPDKDPSAKQLGRIVRSGQDTGNGNIPINVFQPPALDDNIPLLNLSCLAEAVQVIQTTTIVHIQPCHILEVSFVILYPQLLDDSSLLGVSGMKLVRVLRGRMSRGCFEEHFTPSFPSSYEQFHNFYCPFDDVAYHKWVEVVLPIQALLSRLLCRASLQQGDNFCRRRSEPHQFTSYQWHWLSTFLASHGSAIRNVPLSDLLLLVRTAYRHIANLSVVKQQYN
jgi:hypothetical protein